MYGIFATSLAIILALLLLSTTSGSTNTDNTDTTDNADNKDSNNAGKDANKDNGGDGGSEKKYSDEDLDRIINKKFAKWQKEQQKAVDEAAKLADMNAQERAEHERDELQKKLDELTKANTMAQMNVEARKMLAFDGINVPDKLVNMLVSEDADVTKSNVAEFSKLFKAAVLDGVKNANKKQPPKAGGTGTLTREDIMKVTNARERQQLIRENMSLFKK